MMRDCPDGEMRDLLPLFARAALAPMDRVRVEAHVAACADCAAEVALLRSVALAYDVAPVDVTAMAAKMPRHRGAGRSTAHVAFYRQPLWRVAASLTLVIASAAMVTLVKRGAGIEHGMSASAPTVDTAGTPVPESTIAMVDATNLPATDGPRATFGGSLSDLTDSQLEALLASLDALDGNVPADPEVLATPIVLASADTASRRN